MRVSVIMPTMWKSERTEALLNNLNSSSYVDEIIIIDNNRKKCPDLSDLSKVLYLPQDENIYVNPAWNLGVSISKNDHVCLINDDINMDTNRFFEACFKYGKPAIGMHSSCWGYEKSPISLLKGHSLGRGWGCCIFLEKKYWVDIPEQMKIWRGDVWIIKKYPSVHSMIIKAGTEMETTSGRPEMTEIKKNDLKYWNENIID